MAVLIRTIHLRGSFDHGCPVLSNFIGADPNRTLKRLLDRRALAAGRPINLSGGESDEDLISEVNGEAYFNMESFLAEGKSPTSETNEPPEGPVWEW